MRLALRLLPIFVIAILITSDVMLKGCGTALIGGACGGCPNSTAPAGSQVHGPSSSTFAIGSLGGAATVGPFCVNSLTFTITDSSGTKPMSDICVEVFTDGGVALSSASPDCTTNIYSAYIRTRTDSGGTVTLDSLSNIITKPTPSSTSSTATQFVQVTSCSATATWTGTWSVTWN
jgi:hypothetical protein